ncbi:WcaF family extracellular polysaccharide biosynthesis acetyltransferase [Adhaeretor mobilis]|uniref:Maltose O-acetyltransferase n=1 Tax=Adhaeretor mobilis TaxID=1930276 RepID=A0A517MR89_9BACT|nr:WcaF family extracellular polysaccharide biosynthesis acetyltransferase [Adhaeretor mobilis]QDS97395.1 Maltose O-acetyltransferase [Adhaeretor mobilis]
MTENEYESQESWLDLSAYDNSDYDPGRGTLTRTLWYFCSLLFVESVWFPFGGCKLFLLRIFGAKIGTGVTIRSNVRVKYPWLLEVGDHCWIGQDVWIDNLVPVKIGSHVCISQRAYLCTGSHDHRKRTFDLLTGPISIGNGAWVGAVAILLQNVSIGPNALVASGSIVVSDVPAGAIVGGNPAKPIGKRERPIA